MIEIITKIGDHLIQINCKSNDLINFFQKNFLPYTCKVEQELNLIINIDDGYGIPFKDYEVEITKQEDKLFYRRADYLIEVDTQFKSAKLSVHDALALKTRFKPIYTALSLSIIIGAC